MDALIQSVSQTVAQDLRELVHATHPEPAQLDERPPPNWHWGVPLGFASIAAAGTLLIAAGGVQQRISDRQHHARHHQTQMHKHKPHARRQ